MISTKSVEELGQSSLRLTITIPQDEVKREYNELIQKMAKTAQISGFRRGHVPLSILEKKFGQDIKADVLGTLIEKSIEEALESGVTKPLPYGTPIFDKPDVLALDSDFTFSITYDTFPKVDLPEWRGLAIQVPEVIIEDKDIEADLAGMRKLNAVVIERDPLAQAALGDIVTIDTNLLDENGATLPDKEYRDATFELGTHYNLYELDEELVGLRQGDIKVIEKEFPSDYGYKPLAGQKLRIQVEIKKIKEQRLPDLDDDFAQDISDKYKTLDDLKKSLRDRIEERVKNYLEIQKQKSALEQLRKLTNIDIPQSMIDAELEHRLEQTERRLREKGDSAFEQQQLMATVGREKLKSAWEPEARKDIHTQIILQKMIEQLKVEFREEELEAELAVYALSVGVSLEEFKQKYNSPKLQEHLEERIKQTNLMKMILDEARITSAPRVSFMDLDMDKNYLD